MANGGIDDAVANANGVPKAFEMLIDWTRIRDYYGKGVDPHRQRFDFATRTTYGMLCFRGPNSATSIGKSDGDHAVFVKTQAGWLIARAHNTKPTRHTERIEHRARFGIFGCDVTRRALADRTRRHGLR